MRFIVFQGGLGNQMFQYGYYKMMLSRFPKLSYQFAYGNSHNGFELDKWFNVDMSRASLFWKLLFEIIYFLKIKGIIDLIVSEEQYPQKDGWFVAGYWQEQHFTFPYAAQEDRTVYHLFAKSGIPRIYVVDAELTIRSVFTDNPLAGYDELEAAINDASSR